jgi:glycine cleavage system transcriptional repressor
MQMNQLVITAIGPDKPGIVGNLTGHLHAASANILDSRMVNLRGQFAVILLIEADEASTQKIRATLPDNANAIGLHINIEEQKQKLAGASGGGVPYKIKTYSLDQPGIVHKITDVLRKHSVNIEDLSARQESAPFAGSPLFIMEIRITVPANIPLRTLRADLDATAASLNCDLDLEPA